MGPNIGESVLIGWPPDSWVVIDSFCRTSASNQVHPAIDALDHFGGTLEAVALTHPHDDHSRGFAALLDRLKDGGKVGWWPESVTAGSRWSTSNASLAHSTGSNEHAVAAIHRMWTTSPSSKWELLGGSDLLSINGASIETLAPVPQTVADHGSLSSPNVNELSSAMIFRWEACELLLGADLVNTRGWNYLQTIHGELAFSTTMAMKVAHHGSREAQHPVALGTPPPTGRILVGTPYGRGRKVPDFGPGEDVDQLLALSSPFYLSAHHGARPQNSATEEVARSNLLADVLALPGGLGEVQLDVEPAPIGDCWVAIRCGADGVVRSIDRGPGSLQVVP